MIKIITVGKIKEKYIEDGVNDYLKRLSKYTKVKLIEIKEENNKDDISNLKKEALSIIEYIDNKDYIIALDIKGINLDSNELAHKIDDTFINYSNICFIVGSSCGLHDLVKEKCNYFLSFGKNTFPHQMFRMMLLEQIYRAFKINNNERYHK